MICRSQCFTFASAVVYLKTVVARLFLDVAKPKSRRNVSSNKASKEINGVDISDLTRWYDSNEIKRLNKSQAGRRILAKIMGDKKRHQRHKENIDKIKSNKHRRVKSVSRMLAAVINSFSKASNHNASMKGRLIRTRRNDSASTESAVTFDHLGNPL